MIVGDEIAAMKQIESAMEELAPDEARRVLEWATTWANEKLGAEFQVGPSARRESQGILGGGDGDGDNGQFEHLADLVDAAAPSTVAEHALVGAYWLQVLQGTDHVTGQEVNTQLKDLGRGTTDITSAFDALKERKPSLALQLQKSGKTRQARKRYKLTREGIREVRRMVSRQAEA